MNTSDIDLIEEHCIRESRKSFYSYRQYLSNFKLKTGWFVKSISSIIEQFYSDYKEGLRPVYIISTPPQHGKECAVDTPVWTTRGWKNHGDLSVGDEVFHPSGRPIKVVDYIKQPEPCTVEVELSNGEVIRVHPRHEWTVTSHDWRSYKTFETIDLLKSSLVSGIKGKRGSRYRYQLPPTSSTRHTQETELLIDPYFLGVWLGDGAKGSPIIYEGGDDTEVSDAINGIHDLVKTTVHKSTGVKKHTYTRQGIILSMHNYALVRNKHIPAEYLLSSKADRLNLLAGLIDTDGSLHKPTGQYRFINTDKTLIEDCKTLLSTLGYSYSSTVAKEKRTDRKIKDIQDCYQVGFTPTDILPCRMKRKQSTHVKKARKVSIVDIRACAPVEGNCITVDSDDGLYLVGETMQPTHNSSAVTDGISWMAGDDPSLRFIFSSFSERLGIRANLSTQRTLSREKYNKIFPETKINRKNTVTSMGFQRNREMIEFCEAGGSFRNTTVRGSINGESLDIGIIDDPIKGRESANSLRLRDKTWDWFTDDFISRFDELGGLLIITTRWHKDDPVGRLIESNPNVKSFNFEAIAEKDEENRKQGEALFPEHKSLEFLLARKALMTAGNWQALFQGSPVVVGGNKFKSEWWKYYTALPKIRTRIIYGDTAQKKEQQHDYTVFQCWGVSYADQLYLIDQFRGKVEAPELLTSARAFWNKHKIMPGVGTLSAMKIEDKVSGTGLIQTLKREGIPIVGIPRSTDKIMRAEDALPLIESGNVFLPRDVAWLSDYLSEFEQFPNGTNDDQVDPTIDAITDQLGNQVIDYSKLL